MAIPSYPGVYIEEFEPAAPIQGVGTAVAAFLGVSAYGRPMKPTLLTSWDEYSRRFGPPPATLPEDNDYLYYAVRGFFQNGGQTCFVTAVSNAKADYAELDDANGAATIRVTARALGRATTPLFVTSAATSAVSGVELFAPEETVVTGTGTALDLGTAARAAQFLAGDAVTVGGTPATVARTSGQNVYLTEPLAAAVNNVPLRLAPLSALAATFRVRDAATPSSTSAAGLATGSVVTVSQQGGGPAITTVVTDVRAERITPTLTTYRVTVRDPVSGFTLYGGNPVRLQSEEFDVTLIRAGANVAQYRRLSMMPGHPRYYVSVIGSDPSGLIIAQSVEPPNSSALPGNRPIQGGAGAQLQGGESFNPSAITANDYVDALALNATIRDINMVVTDRTDTTVQQAVLDHCTLSHDRFAIFDSVKGTALQDIETQRASLESDDGFGALYYPWISVTSVKSSQPILIPPSGHVAGIYARTDTNRGVFKAPAGNDCVVNGAIGAELQLSDIDQGVVNMKGVNVIRVFQNGGRPIVWGARTTSANTNWQYVNIRRLFLFLEESIQVGIRGAVFEPNNQALWQRLRRTISAFLTEQWRGGALYGARAQDAFYVRIDEVLNPDSERALGRLTIEIGVRPSYPAEFIIVRIGIWQGGSEISES